jgi:hypothetical protein
MRNEQVIRKPLLELLWKHFEKNEIVEKFIEKVPFWQ